MRLLKQCSAVPVSSALSAVLLLDLPAFKHAATLSAAGVEITVWFLQIEYGPLICKQIPSCYLSCCFWFRQAVSAGAGNKLRGVKGLSFVSSSDMHTDFLRLLQSLGSVKCIALLVIFRLFKSDFCYSISNNGDYIFEDT